jgi:CRP/FNR family transcriptional regulator
VDVNLERVVESSALGDLPASALTAVLAGSYLQSWFPGRSFADSRSGRAALVVDGLVCVSLSAPTGRRATIRYARPGELLGVAALPTSDWVTVETYAVTETSLLMLDGEALTARAQHDARVAWWVAQETSRRLGGVLEELSRQAFWPVRRRVARHLLDVAVLSETGLRVTLSQQDLADAAGTVREVVARTLAALKAEGLVQSVCGGIDIIDPVRLDAIACGG